MVEYLDWTMINEVAGKLVGRKRRNSEDGFWSEFDDLGVSNKEGSVMFNPSSPRITSLSTFIALRHACIASLLPTFPYRVDSVISLRTVNVDLSNTLTSVYTCCAM
jgi:hypothetical protein